MSDLPPRLLDDPQLDPVARSVLRSADTDAPSADRRAAVAAGLGLSALVSGGATSASAAATAWWLAPLVVVGIATTGLLGYVATRPAPAPVVVKVEVEAGPRASGLGPRADQRTPPPPAAIEEAAAEPAEPAVAVEPVPPRKPRAPKPEARGPRPEAPLPAPEPASPPSVDASQLAEETAMLSEANAALRAGDPAAAQAALDRHAARFPAAILDVEAKVIRIDAVLRTDHAAGVALGERFLATYPKSPHAKRVRSLLARKAK
jgi:hypothetical protein